MLKNVEAVLFDLDGSLVDSMWIWQEIDVEYLQKFGITLPENLQTEIEGISNTRFLRENKVRLESHGMG